MNIINFEKHISSMVRLLSDNDNETFLKYFEGRLLFRMKKI